MVLNHAYIFWHDFTNKWELCSWMKYFDSLPSPFQSFHVRFFCIVVMLSAKKQRKLKWIYWAPWKSSRNPFFVVTFTHTSRCKRGNMWATLASLMFFFGRWDDIKQETGELQFLCMRNISHFIRDENEFLRIYHRMIAHSMGINQNYLSSSSALSYEHCTEGGKAAFVDFNCSFCCKLSGNTISQVETHRAEILTSWCFVFGFPLRGWDSIELVRMMAKSRKRRRWLNKKGRKSRKWPGEEFNLI